MHDPLDDEPAPHREFTLSTPLIVVLFLALAALCGVFFGLGYRSHHAKQLAAMQAAAEPSDPQHHVDFSGFKPPAGSAANAPRVAAAPSASTTVSTEAALPVAHPAEPAHVASPVPPLAVAASPATVPAGSFVVQLAAISAVHAEDAEMLVGALHAKGYSAAAHKEADGLLHVQVGPFANRKDAEAMRTRLESDGYKPFIK